MSQSLGPSLTLHASRADRTTETATPAISALRSLQEQFLSEQRFLTRLAPETLRGYGQTFAVFQSLMPTITADQLTAAAFTEFFRRLATRTRTVGPGRERRGVKTSTVATYRSKLNRFCEWLTLRGEIRGNPFHGMAYPDVRYEDRQFLPRQSVERIFASLALGLGSRSRLLRRRNVAIFAVLLYTGLRRGELLALRVIDVDFARLQLTVRAETSKSRRQRVVPINSQLLQALEDYWEERRRQNIECASLFTSGTGKGALTADGLKHLVERVRRKSGVAFHLHQFRHTFAVNLLNRGGDVAKLKQLLGHRDIRMTSTYLRCLPTSAMRTDVENVTLDSLL